MKTIEIEVSFVGKDGQQAKDSLVLKVNDDDCCIYMSFISILQWQI